MTFEEEENIEKKPKVDDQQMDARFVCSAVWTESTRGASLADSSSISSAAVEELADGHGGLNGQTLINATITGAM